MKKVKLIFKIIISFAIIPLLQNNAQEIIQPDSLSFNQNTIDSSETVFENRIIYNPFFFTNKVFLGQREFDINHSTFPLQPITLTQTQPADIRELKMQIRSYLKQRRDLLPNYDLGDFGEYLGYANTLAVIILAISHISKYGFK